MKRVERMTIEAARVKKKPDFRKTAAELLERCREFYRDEENEKAFLEWKAGRNVEHEKAV